jgi:hypothetical protein
MSTKRTSSSKGRGQDAVRLATRAKGIRAQLRSRHGELDRYINQDMAGLAKQILTSVYRHRVKVAKWSDLNTSERNALVSIMSAASFLAADMGITREGFAQWLRDGAELYSWKAGEPPPPAVMRVS